MRRGGEEIVEGMGVREGDGWVGEEDDAGEGTVGGGEVALQMSVMSWCTSGQGVAKVYLQVAV